MRAVAHSPSFAKKVGIPQSVGKEFAAADKGKFMKKKFGIGKVKKYSGEDGSEVKLSGIDVSKLPSGVKPIDPEYAAKFARPSAAAQANEKALTKTLNAPSAPPVKTTPAPSRQPTPAQLRAAKMAQENEDSAVKNLTTKDTGMKKGGKVAPKKWEGSAKDEAQDKKLAKKHNMSMSKWESSKMDEKHDRQQSMKGLKKGGTAKMCGGGKAYATGGKVRGNGIASRGKTRGRFC